MNHFSLSGEMIIVGRGIGVGKERGEVEKRDWVLHHGPIEVFNTESPIEEIAQAILEAAHCGFPGDGIVAILPAERLYRIRTRTKGSPEDI